MSQPYHAHTGLAVLARTERVASLRRLDGYSRTSLGRPRYLVAECGLSTLDTPFFFVVNHWRSRLEVTDSNAIDAAKDRLDTAKTLREWLKRRSLDACVVVIGDFNAEPFEEPLGELGLGAVRHLGPGLALPKRGLYNTAWRFLSEPDPCEKVLADGEAYHASRTKTTLDAYRHSDAVSIIFDQLLVSESAVRGGPIMLQEASVRYAFHPPIGHWHRRDGHVRPQRWSYSGGTPAGASDHLPLTATFRVRTETQP